MSNSHDTEWLKDPNKSRGEGSRKNKLYSISIKISNKANQNKPFINAKELVFLEQTTTKCWVCPKWMRIPQNAGLDVLL